MKVITAVVLFTALINVGIAEKKIFCYHGTWSTYRQGNGKFNVENIDPNLCTHLAYAFFGIQKNGELRIADAYLDLEENWGRGNIKKFNNLKLINPKLKTLAAIGGWNEGSVKFSDAAKDPIKRARFIKSSVDFILKHKFDGLDFDWEYPAQRGGDVQNDKQNFIIFIKEIKEEFNKHNLLLSAAVASAEFSASMSYDIPQMMKYFDFINVMTYDLHGSFDAKLGINAPLYEGCQDKTTIEKQLNLQAIINYWIRQGAQPEKLILGVPTYGRTFTLIDPANNTIGSPHKGPGLGGKYSNERGMIGYNELCEEFKTGQWTIKWEPQQLVPYAYKGNQWVGFDNATSIELKVDFAKQHNLGGIMVWAVETDDFKGISGSKYPLLKKINEVLKNNKPTTSASKPTVKPTFKPTLKSKVEPVLKTTTSTTTSTPRPTIKSIFSKTPKEFKCKEDGFFRDPYDCAKFYRCDFGRTYSFNCADGTLFDTLYNVCNHQYLVDCLN